MITHSARTRSAFSLVEMLFVLVVMGILVGLVVPRWQYTKAKALTSVLVNDLKNLSITEETYWNDADTYTSDLGVLKFVSTPNVTINFASVDKNGWSATATHSSIPGTVCAIYYGNAPPLPPASSVTQVKCQ